VAHRRIQDFSIPQIKLRTPSRSTSTARRHSTKPFPLSKPDAWSSASNGTAPQRTVVGSIWPKPNSAQCLDRRIPDEQTLIEEIAAWEHDRNANKTKANWHFTTPNARINLKHLYPSI
jgi:hypothetical protein